MVVGGGTPYAVLYRYPHTPISIRAWIRQEKGVGPIPKSNTILAHRFSIYLYPQRDVSLRFNPFATNPTISKKRVRQILRVSIKIYTLDIMFTVVTAIPPTLFVSRFWFKAFPYVFARSERVS